MAVSPTPNTPYLSQKILSALEFASIAHRQQLRKGPDQVPYISHPAAVGMILWKAGYSEDVVIAGILHDVIEDTSFGYEDIEKKFGKQIADWVADVSENQDLPINEMKEQYLVHLQTAPAEAKAVSAADLLANRYEMLLDLQAGLDLWKVHWEKNVDRDRRRLEIIKPAVTSELAEEVEQVTKQVHQFFIKN